MLPQSRLADLALDSKAVETAKLYSLGGFNCGSEQRRISTVASATIIKSGALHNRRMMQCPNCQSKRMFVNDYYESIVLPIHQSTA
jgi:DNA-directed RNA polymerase subunit RPC12/RpoP